MKILKLLNILLAFYFVKEDSATQCKESDNEPWSYNGKNNGPKDWKKTYPTCNDQSQSPIDIKSAKVKKDYNLKHLVMTNYDKSVTNADIINDGHTVMITPKDNVNRTISINGETYRLRQLHFHWGSRSSNKGSEHTFDSKAYEMEAHFVHANDRGELAVVGVLFRESLFISNTGFKAIIGVFDQIRFKNQTTQLQSPLDLQKFFPELPLQIYRYTGSLTTPGCTEGVTWSVARHTIKIGNWQINDFRSLYSVTSEDDKAGCHLQVNFRPVQPLNGRTVTMSTSND